MRKPAVVAAMVVLTLSLGTCAWMAKTAAEAVRPVYMPALGGALERAAQAAQGLRVMTIVRKPGTEPVVSVYESARGSSGWGAWDPTPTADDALLPALRKLCDAAGADFARDGRMSPPTQKALALLGVGVLVAGDGTNVVLPDAGERDPAVGTAPEVPALRFRHAQPVFLFLAEEPTVASDDVISFARTLRKGDANFTEYEDRAPWGGAMTVEMPADGEVLIPWPAQGARVAIDGAPATFRAARVPVLLVKVPAGRHRIDVRYGEDASGREWLTIAASLGVVVSLLALWIGLRPHPE